VAVAERINLLSTVDQVKEERDEKINKIFSLNRDDKNLISLEVKPDLDMLRLLSNVETEEVSPPQVKEDKRPVSVYKISGVVTDATLKQQLKVLDDYGDQTSMYSPIIQPQTPTSSQIAPIQGDNVQFMTLKKTMKGTLLKIRASKLMGEPGGTELFPGASFAVLPPITADQKSSKVEEGKQTLRPFKI
jgi:hypothetical protein